MSGEILAILAVGVALAASLAGSLDSLHNLAPNIFLSDRKGKATFRPIVD